MSEEQQVLDGLLQWAWEGIFEADIMTDPEGALQRIADKLGFQLRNFTPPPH